MDKKNKKATYIYIVVMYILIFQNALQMYLKIFQYIDEVLALLGMGLIVYDIIKSKGKISKKDGIILLCLSILSVIGIYSVISYKYQNIKYSLIDWLLVMKFFAVYFGTKILTKNKGILLDSNLIYKFIKYIVIILLATTIANYVFDLFPEEKRYGIMANRIFYGHPTYLAAASITLIVNIVLFSKKIKNIYLVICFIILFSTLRSKAIAAGIVILILIVYIHITSKKISLIKLGLLGIIAIMIALPQINFYFIGADNSARSDLMNTSIKIANDYFPIGTGFGTFGSFVSGENYSEIYEVYGIDDTFGLSKGNSTFLSDNFWPMIIGQFGYIGMILYLICIVCIFIDIQKSININKYVYMAKIGALTYLLISSIAEASFVNPIAIPLAVIIGLQINNNGDKNNKE